MIRLSNLQFINSLEELPSNKRVCLCNAGEGGLFFKNILERHRGDIKVVYFVDDFRSGQIGEVKIIRPADLHMLKNEFDIIIVTSAFWIDMAKRLDDIGIKNYLVANLILMYEDMIFLPVEEDKYRESLLKTEALLKHPEDRRLYRLISKCRTIYPEPQLEFYEYIKSNPFQLERKYIEFINEKVNVIIEGGVSDAKTTVNFLQLLGKGGFIYGFEPFYQFYNESKHKEFLETLSNVKIFPDALWKHRGILNFSENHHDKKASKISVDDNFTRSVNAISIDEFADENRIEKIDFIKLDVEGAEFEILQGAQRSLKEHRPHIAVCLYHKKEHLFEIPLFLDSVLENYEYRIVHYTSTFWETVWYAIPIEYAKV